MNDSNLNTEWAWARVEAMADGSLTGAERHRMRRAMRDDPALRAAVGRGRALRRELAELGRASVPGTLGRRLLAIASTPRARVGWGVPALTAAAGAAVAVAGLLALQQIPHAPTERELALQEFRVAMHYLQQSAIATGDDVTRSLTHGLREALAVSSSVLESESQNGEQSDAEE